VDYRRERVEDFDAFLGTLKVSDGRCEVETVGLLLLKPREAARALAISERTLWELTKRGKIPHVRIGRAVRYAPADLEAWIESRKSGARCSGDEASDQPGD
jgi:excisionase family DNA binding protein